MKIVFFVADFSGGGAERVVSLLGNELVGRGYEILLLLTLIFLLHILFGKIFFFLMSLSVLEESTIG